jgi:hypothetical protein
MRNDDFVALDIIQAHNERNRFGGAHARMWLIIAASPYLIRESRLRPNPPIG